MKKLITTTLLVLFFGYVYAQKDVTTFLGIPVDGKKKEITKKLKAKGFKYDYNTKTLRGIFNGMDSYVYIQTNKDNLVHSISVVDVNPTPVVLIKYRYNNLIEEFSGKKDKYVEVDNYQPIPEDENIDYEMSVHKKLYKAKFCQIPNMDLFKNENNNQRVYNRLRQTFTSSQLVNPTDDEEKEIKQIQDDENAHIWAEIASKKLVGFMIFELNGEYRISYSYMNLYNNTNEDDL